MTIVKGPTPVIIIAGATASGKSSLAIKYAHSQKSVIINADSVQLYRNLPILSAQPCLDSMDIPHELYGCLSHEDNPWNVATWALKVKDLIEKAWQEGLTPIVVGGTGFYLQILEYGISPIPAVSAETKRACGDRVREGGLAALFSDLILWDPEFLKKVSPSDMQRLQRAWQVHHHTHKAFSAWQKLPRQPFLPQAQFHKVFMNPPRQNLKDKIALRATQMIERGAVAEVQALLDLGLPPDHHLNKVLGVQPIAEFIKGAISLEEALALLITQTNQYAKRQATWFRHQFKFDQQLLYYKSD